MKEEDVSIRDAFWVIQGNLLAHAKRLGERDIEGWSEMTPHQQGMALCVQWPEVTNVIVALNYMQLKLENVGRTKGQRTKLTDEDVARIKKNGHRNIAALAKRLGVTRQTIYNVLDPKPETKGDAWARLVRERAEHEVYKLARTKLAMLDEEEASQKSARPRDVAFDEDIHSHQAKGRRRPRKKSSDDAD